MSIAPWLDDGDVALYHGSAIDVLRALPAGSVQTCVTSPPYWGLRDYGTGSWTGGADDCDHRERKTRNDGLGDVPCDRGAGGSMVRSGGNQAASATYEVAYRDVCGKCGAQRVDAQLGLEPTPTEYVTSLVAVFAEVWRVLRADGTLWLNLGDSYCSHKPRGGATYNDSGKVGAQTAAFAGARAAVDLRQRPELGIKDKDLVGVPWRVAFALQEAGWYLRSDVIWAKPNPMPESVTDRPTKAHEYVFLLAKQPRYYYDADAIREAAEPWNSAKGFSADGQALRGGAVGHTNGKRAHSDEMQTGRNARSVWEIATQPTPDAHFATFPEALVRRCILAGSREGDQVLDPFIGSGTTALVARKHGRRATGIDLSADYLAIAARRLGQQSLFATSEGAA